MSGYVTGGIQGALYKLTIFCYSESEYSGAPHAMLISSLSGNVVTKSVFLGDAIGGYPAIGWETFLVHPGDQIRLDPQPESGSTYITDVQVSLVSAPTQGGGGSSGGAPVQSAARTTSTATTGFNGTCTLCGGTCPPGVNSNDYSKSYPISLNSIDVNISLGTSTQIGPTGEISLHARDRHLGAALYSPSSLAVVPPPGSVTKLDGNGTFYQLLTPEVLVVANVTGNNSYNLDFYQRPVSPPLSMNGNYYIPPDGGPYLTWKFEDPGGNGTVGSHLKVTKTIANTTTTVSQYDWITDTFNCGESTFAMEGWLLTITEGNTVVSKEAFLESQPINGVYADMRVKYNLSDDSDASFLFRVQEFLKSKYVVKLELYDRAGTRFRWTQYWDSLNDGNKYGQMKSVLEPTGQWTYYADYDVDGDVLNRVEQFKSNPFTGAWPDNVNRSFETTQSAATNTTISLEAESLGGTVAGKKWHVLSKWGNLTDGKNDYRWVTDNTAVSPGVTDWDDSTNIGTKTILTDAAMSGSGNIEGLPAAVLHSNNRIEVYWYIDGTREVQIRYGLRNYDSAPNSGYPLGWSLGGFLYYSNTQTDNQSHLNHSISYLPGGSFEIENWSAGGYDQWGRPTSFTTLNGLTGYNSYDCCGLSSTTDGYGVTTSYIHNWRNQVTVMTQYDLSSSDQPPVRTEYQYDAVGRQTKVLVGPSGGNQVTQSENTYNIFGELTSTKDALARETDYAVSYAGDLVIHTTTYPDGSTRVEKYYQDGSLYEVGGTAARGVRYDYGISSGGNQTTTTTPLDANGSPIAAAAVTQERDFAGRDWRTTGPSPSGLGSATTTNTYDATGQLVKVSRTGVPDTLYTYDDWGVMNATCVDINGNGNIDFSGVDRLTQTDTDYGNFTVGGSTVTAKRVVTTQWVTANTSVTTTANTALAGLDATVVADGLTANTTMSVDAGNATVTTTAANPDGTQVVTVTKNGRTASVAQLAVGGGQLGKKTYTYDAYGRLAAETDARAGATTYAYDGLGRMTATTLPAPGGGASAQVVTHAYADDTANGGRTETVRRRVGSTSGNIVEESVLKYDAVGQLRLSYGAGGYAVGYEYDYAGRKTKQTTWQDFNTSSGSGTGGAADTRWHYNDAGMLTQKRYADGSGPAYTYDSAGRTLTRQWARSVTTVSGNTTSTAPLTATFSYNGTTGDPVGIAYNDGLTPNVTFSDYDRLGRAGNITDGAGTRSLTYTHGVLTAESYGGGVLANTTLSRGLDSNYRVANLTVGNYTLAYDYDSASGRLANVTWGNESVSYAYVANSTLISTITSKHNGNATLTANRTFDNMSRLISSNNTLTGGNQSISYAYNDRNQRTSATNQDSEFWTYGYDSDGVASKTGQVTSAIKKLGNSTAIPGTDLAYAYDDIGNLQSATKNGSTWGPQLESDGTTGANLLNQYELWSGPRTLEFMGSSNTSANVTVNGNSTLRAGKYWYANLTLSGNDAQWIALNITGVVGGNTSIELGHDLLKPEPTHLQYDADGNLIEDGKWHYAYDGENRMIVQETSDIAITAGAPHERIEHVYDNMGRCINTKVYHWQTVVGASVRNPDPAMNVNYLYDGWNMVAELDGNNSNAILRNYAWGLDLGGTSGGAGGIGGLLMADLRVPTGGGNFTTNRVLYGYDGNGNVITLAASNTGNLVATYDYDPFGNTVRIEGSLAAYNCFRFSTKWLETDAVVGGRDLGLYNYGRRFFELEIVRFLNKDPSEEQGGNNLYTIVGNNLINFFDAFGLDRRSAPDWLRNPTQAGNGPRDYHTYAPEGSFDGSSTYEILSTKLLEHYVSRSASLYTISDMDMKGFEIEPEINLTNFKVINNLFYDAQQRGQGCFFVSESLNATSFFHSRGEYDNIDANNSFGPFKIHIRGQGVKISDNPLQWKFTGQYRLEDTYDFSPPYASWRSIYGNLKALGMWLVPGVPFEVRSNWYDLEQNLAPADSSATLLSP